jgi:hypothetical protein
MTLFKQENDSLQVRAKESTFQQLAFAPSGRWLPRQFSQGVALGKQLLPPSGRFRLGIRAACSRDSLEKMSFVFALRRGNFALRRKVFCVKA